MEFEKINVASIDEVEERLAEIRSLDIDKMENVEEITKEVDALKERRKALKESADAKKELRNKILNGEVETQVIEKPQEERKMELNKTNYLTSNEYRSAFMKTLQGKDLTVEERSAMAMADVTGIVPTSTQNTILSKVKEYAPILNDIELLAVNGVVTVPVENELGEAVDHTENAVIEAVKDTFTPVTLTAKEIVKLVQVSDSVKTMSIPVFEAWLVEKIATALAMKIEGKIFAEILANGTTAVTGEANLTNILTLFGKLKSGYGRMAKVYMSSETLYTKVIALQDKAKNDLVVREGDTYKLLGKPIELTESVGTAIVLGAPKKFVGNLAETINVKHAFDINTNSYKYLGVAMFDGKVGIAEAFQILKTA